MLKEVPTENEVVSIYMKNPKPGTRFMSPSMQATLESTVAPKRTGGKRKGKAVEEIVSDKPSKRQKRVKDEASVYYGRTHYQFFLIAVSITNCSNFHSYYHYYTNSNINTYSIYKCSDFNHCYTPTVSSIATLIPLSPPIFTQSTTTTTTSSTTIPHSPLI